MCHVTERTYSVGVASFGEFPTVKCDLIVKPVSCNTAKTTLYGELFAVRSLRYLVSTRPTAPSCRVTTIPSQVIRTGATASSPTRGAATTQAPTGHAARVLLPLLGIYALGTVSLQGFNLVYLRVAADIGAGDASGLITAIPGIVLGVACFLYGTLGDFIPLRRIVDAGVALIVAGSLLGFLFSSSLAGIIIARALQTLGYQAAASAYMILATGIADPKRRSLYVGLMCAAFQGGTAIGMLSGGLLADVNWALLLLTPLGGLAFLPIMGRRVPARASAGRVDVVGLAIFSGLALLLTLAASDPCWWLIGGLILGGVIFWRYIGRARSPFITRSFFTNVPWARSVSLIVIIYCMNFTVAPLMNGIGALTYGLNPAQVSIRLLPAYCVALTTAMTSGTVMARIGRGATVRGCVSLILAGTALLALFMSSGPWIITVAMCLIYAGFGALFTPIYDTVFATVAPGQNGRAVAMNDLAMQGSAAIGIGVFTPWLASGSFHAIALVCVGAATTGILGDWTHEYLYRKGR